MRASQSDMTWPAPVRWISMRSCARHADSWKQYQGRPTGHGGFQEVGLKLGSRRGDRKCVRSNTESRRACVVDVGFAVVVYRLVE